MNISNLTNGQVVKSYKQLCEIIGEKNKGGDSKKAQLKEFERYVKYHKDGNKFVIDEIYEEPLKKVDNRGGKSAEYIKDIEINIMGELYRNGKKNDYVVGTTYLLRSTGMMNVNYSYCKKRQDKLATYLDIDNDIVYDYYTSVDSMLSSNLYRSLLNLENKALIELNITTIVCKNITQEVSYEHTIEVDKYEEDIEIINPRVDYVKTFNEASQLENEIILKSKGNVLDEMGLKTISSVFSTGRINEYYNRLNEVIRNKIPNFNFCFKAYKISYNFDRISDELESEGYKEWGKETKNKKENSINSDIRDKIIENAIKRKNRKEKEYENSIGSIKQEDKHACRLNDSYIKDYFCLNSKVIDLDMGDIREKVKKSIK